MTEKGEANLPKISFVLCTFNGERTLEKCLASFFSQDYPLSKIELIIADGGSKDKTLEIISAYKKKYPKIVKFFHNNRQFADGKGNGIDLFSRKAKHELIGFIDQDNIFVQKEWIKKMIQPFLHDKEISAVQSRLAVPKKGNFVDKYFGMTGMEDPFAIPYSLSSQTIFNPQRFQYHQKGDYYSYRLSKNKFLYGGNNGCIVRRDKFFEAGGYSQDNDEFYRFALKHYKVAVPKNAKLHHWTATDFRHFLVKRGKYVVYYLSENYEKRDVYWFSLRYNNFVQNFKFIKILLFNLMIIPGLIEGLYMAIKQKKLLWLVHPLMLFSVTLDYIICAIYSKVKNKKEKIDLSSQARGRKK